MFQEEGYWEGNVCTCFRKKDIGKEMFAHVLGRRTLGRKYLSCFREKDIGKEMFTHVSGRRILGRKC